MNKELLSRLGDPQAGQSFIHVAGTNGKGSTCAMLAEILKCAGYKTGLFTSPHLERYNERFKVNGEEISDADLMRLKAIVDDAANGLETVEFDRLTAMGFLYFKEQGCDITVLEVGLGGRFDATNAITDPVVSVIAEIGLEHTEILGDSIEQIAFEKAGIMKEGRPAVCMYQENGALDVFKNRADEMGCKMTVTDPARAVLHSISFDSQIISYRNRKELSLALLGSYQFKNVMLVLDTIDELKDQGYDIPDEAVRDGLMNVSWPGRFEVLRKYPLVIIDGAHNPSGAGELAECIKSLFSASYTIFDPVPMNAADMSKKEIKEYVKSQIAKWYSYKIANLDSCDYLSSEQMQMILIALRDSVDYEELFHLIKYNLGQIEDFVMADAARYPLSLAFGNLLQKGTLHVESDTFVGDRNPAILGRFIQAAKDKDSDKEGSPYYHVILSPFISRLETLSKNCKAGARPPQEGDAELKAIFDKIESSATFQI